MHCLENRYGSLHSKKSEYIRSHLDGENWWYQFRHADSVEIHILIFRFVFYFDSWSNVTGSIFDSLVHQSMLYKAGYLDHDFLLQWSIFVSKTWFFCLLCWNPVIVAQNHDLNSGIFREHVSLRKHHIWQSETVWNCV